MNDERRRHKRIALKLTVSCQKVGISDGRLYSGRTVNVSPGGMLVEMNGHSLRDGELLSVEMNVPSTEGFLDFGGSFSSYARVIRKSDNLVQPQDLDNAVALEFCDSPKFRL